MPHNDVAQQSFMYIANNDNANFTNIISIWVTNLSPALTEKMIQNNVK